jgi:phosphoribosylamine--glycine ligase
MESVTDEKLSGIPIRFSDSHSACVILASGGYPADYKTGFVINGLDINGTLKNNTNSQVTVYHAGTTYKDGDFLTSGGRVLGITTTASTLNTALEEAYKAAEKISFEGIHYRKDIGKY